MLSDYSIIYNPKVHFYTFGHRAIAWGSVHACHPADGVDTRRFFERRRNCARTDS